VAHAEDATAATTATTDADVAAAAPAMPDEAQAETEEEEDQEPTAPASYWGLLRAAKGSASPAGPFVLRFFRSPRRVACGGGAALGHDA
jgi:hypothetical protein